MVPLLGWCLSYTSDFSSFCSLFCAVPAEKWLSSSWCLQIWTCGTLQSECTEEFKLRSFYPGILLSLQGLFNHFSCESLISFKSVKVWSRAWLGSDQSSVVSLVKIYVYPITVWAELRSTGLFMCEGRSVAVWGRLRAYQSRRAVTPDGWNLALLKTGSLSIQSRLLVQG